MLSICSLGSTHQILVTTMTGRAVKLSKQNLYGFEDCVSNLKVKQTLA